MVVYNSSSSEVYQKDQQEMSTKISGVHELSTSGAEKELPTAVGSHASCSPGIPISMTRNSEREYTVVQCMAGQRNPNEKRLW